jgi:7-carboxy-7-deazaguanine synthase
MDLKTPASGEMKKNLMSNLEHLKSSDQIKFVICNREDYEWAKEQMEHYNLGKRFQVLFSPSYKEVEANILADWVLADRLPVRLQIQLHKYLWGEKPGV